MYLLRAIQRHKNKKKALKSQKKEERRKTKPGKMLKGT